MAAALERARQRERQFLLSVSHDLRTPLTAIAGWGEALADGTAPDPAAAGRIVTTEAGRLDRLVGDLLDLARLRARAFPLAVEPVDLVDVVAGTVEGLRPDLEDAGLAVTLDVPAGPVVVTGDGDRLAQVVANLVGNAGRHAVVTVGVTVAVEPSPPGPGADPAPVAASPGAARAPSPSVTGPSAVVTVDDDGPGIPPGERSAVFERLHTAARPAARPWQGTGLGLAIVREIVVASGGTVAATDGPSGGARLVVRLPLRPPPD
jgi:signal transduction histidine kinase